MNPKAGRSGLTIRIQDKLKFGPQHSIARFSNKTKELKKFILMLIQKSQQAGANFGLFLFMPEMAGSSDQVLFLIIQAFEKMNEWWLWRNFVREGNSSGLSNGRLKCKAVTSLQESLRL